jgi:hypothetical protein
MKTTTAYTDALQTMRDELADCLSRSKQLRSAIKVLSDLCDQSSGTPRKATRRSRGEVPAELADMTCGDRILHVMRGDPDRVWTTAELAVAAYTATTATARTTLLRLASKSAVAITDTGGWRLTTPTATVQ